jgi:hypothetical protein
MTFATNRPLAATLARAPLATVVDHARPLIVPGFLWRAATAIGDLLTALGMVLCIPFVILAFGIPIALCVRLLLWIAGALWGLLPAAAS